MFDLNLSALDGLRFIAAGIVAFLVASLFIVAFRACAVSIEDRIKAREKAPYWWPETRSVMQLFLSFSIVSMVGFIIYQLMSNQIKLEQDQRDLLMILFGIVLGCFKDVYSYTYGSSAGERDKGEVISKSIETKDKIISDNVAATAASVVTATETAMRAATAAIAPTVSAAAAAAAAAPAAAAEAAPAAAAAAAPPAAEVAAPPAAEAAVDAALHERGIVGVSWWNALTDAERIALNIAAGNDARVQKFQDDAIKGKAAPEDVDYLVSQALLTKERGEELKAI